MGAEDHPPYEREQCGCKAPILWAVTSKGVRMPVDYEPVAVNGGGGNVRLTYRPGQLPLARVVTNMADLFGATQVYRSHFATCPSAAYYRRRPRPSGKRTLA